MAKCLGFLLKLVAFAFLCMTVNWPQRGEAAADCNTVARSLVSCVPYINGQPDRGQQCCKNVRTMVDSANKGTRAGRQAICYCLKRFSSGFSRANIVRANTLPRHCGRSIPYTFSRNMDCSRVR